MRMRKKIISLLIVMVWICCTSITAFAHDVPDMAREGSVSITMHDGDTAVSGGSLTLYRVGDIQENDGDYSFVLAEDFAACDASLTDIQSAQLAKHLSVYAAENKLKGTEKTIARGGTVVFDGLKAGLYLFVQEEAAAGYHNVEPFLVSVPMQEEGQYVYDIDASPKVELEKAPETETTSPDKPSDSTLPQTGQLNWPIPILAVSGLALFAIGWVLRLEKKKDGYEK